ncbi:hypothetical protein [Engelhardtia mirabilis]|uniref:HEAT repeat protein n=1 Tax=Engelhardtia mirabilis TaxID=2528011 RepID=A0A518BEV9_9BACT|nr:hypothetical protein Pla133_05820 [Planctomycetes bacterium Pla133]QDU99843.1 hypothetical protein Pla86_05820 [Planctomycetes bacterium Pla86]
MARAAAGTLLALIALALPSAAQSKSADELIDRALQTTASATDDAHRELVALGKSILPTVLARLDRLASNPVSGQPEGAEFELLSEVLAELPRPDVHRALEPEPEITGTARCARIGALSRFGLSAEVNLLIALAGPCERAGPVTRAVQACAERMHRRSASSLRGIASTYLRASMPLREALVRGISAVARLDSVEVLADLLDLAPELDPLILSSIGRIGSLDPLEISERVRSQVRRLLDLEHDDRRLGEAALTAGRLEDPLALDTLVHLLESPSAAVRGNVHWSLQHVSGLPLEDDYFRWLTWLRANERWWAEEWPAIRAALRGGGRSETCEALREIAGRRYRRHDLAQEVLHVLRRSDDDVLLGYSCLALTALDSPIARESLIELLLDDRELVRTRALEALRHITSLDLPADIEAWRTALSMTALEP